MSGSTAPDPAIRAALARGWHLLDRDAYDNLVDVHLAYAAPELDATARWERTGTNAKGGPVWRFVIGAVKTSTRTVTTDSPSSFAAYLRGLPIIHRNEVPQGAP